MNAPQTNSRLCPSGCGPLRPFTFRGVTLDRCPQCAGTWFDAGEYDNIERMPEAAFHALEGLTGDAASRGRVPEGNRRCPACAARLAPLTLQHLDVSLRLDQCPHCEGLWAEDREMELLSQALERHKPSFSESLSGGVRDEIAWAIAEETATHETHRAHVFQSVVVWVRRWGKNTA